jgi:hypothetical protein
VERPERQRRPGAYPTGHHISTDLTLSAF